MPGCSKMNKAGLHICAMINSQIKEKNMVNATNVSQKESKCACGTFHPEELRLKKIIEGMKSTSSFSPDDWKFICKELHLNLRTIYGVYLAMCAEENITKVLTWRTFYMQCNGYRTLKPNTMRAVVKYVTTLRRRTVENGVVKDELAY